MLLIFKCETGIDPHLATLEGVVDAIRETGRVVHLGNNAVEAYVDIEGDTIPDNIFRNLQKMSLDDGFLFNWHM